MQRHDVTVGRLNGHHRRETSANNHLQKAFAERPGVIRAYFAAIASAYKTMLADCWLVIDDFAPAVAGEKTQGRPVLADAVVSHRPILVHTHAAETLQVSLVLLAQSKTGKLPLANKLATSLHFLQSNYGEQTHQHM